MWQFATQIEITQQLERKDEKYIELLAYVGINKEYCMYLVNKKLNFNKRNFICRTCSKLP